MKQKYLEWIRDILESDAYLRRLRYFHRYYQNVKCELRYRDAILQLFNARHRKDGVVAYAEVGKVDLAIFADGSNDPFRIEFKYQYTYDMAVPVGNEIKRSRFEGILANAKNEERKSRSVAEKIVRDCIDVDCDGFILVVQDRTGHPEEGNLRAGVEANFVHHQRQMDNTHGPNTKKNKNAWLGPTGDLLSQILSKTGGESLLVLERRVWDDPGAPLTSHFFMLDMTARHLAKAA